MSMCQRMLNPYYRGKTLKQLNACHTPKSKESQTTDTQQRYAARAKATFPDCYAKCELVKMLGVGECESACPEQVTGNVSIAHTVVQNLR